MFLVKSYCVHTFRFAALPKLNCKFNLIEEKRDDNKLISEAQKIKRKWISIKSSTLSTIIICARNAVRSKIKRRFKGDATVWELVHRVDEVAV